MSEISIVILVDYYARAMNYAPGIVEELFEY